MRLLVIALLCALPFCAQGPSIFFTTNTATLTTAATPTFSPVAGTVAEDTEVTISTSTPGGNAQIFYTADGSEPDSGDTQSTTVIITASMTVKAKVIGLAGYNDSAVGSAAYTVVIPPNDTFTGAAATNLTSHTSDSGHTWSAKGASSQIELDGSGNAQALNEPGTTGAVYFSSWTPPSADYDVTITAETTDKSLQAICRGTGTTGLSNGYLGGYNHTATQLWIRRYSSGSATTIGTPFTTTLTAGDTLTLSCVGTAIAVSKNGTPLVSTTDATHSGAGSAGIGIRTNGKIRTFTVTQ
jgi:hypothetical protein